MCQVRAPGPPAKTVVDETLNSKFGVGFKLIFCPCRKGCRSNERPNCPTMPVSVWYTKLWPSNCPRKHSKRIGPSHPKMLGNLKGETRLIRNIFSGSALLLNINGPPSAGLHDRLCFPNEICQFSKLIPTYASSNRTRLTEEIGVAGGTPGMLSTEAINCRAPSGWAGADGECWYSART